MEGAQAAAAPVPIALPEPKTTLFVGGGLGPVFAFSPDGKTLATGSFNGLLQEWDLESGQLKKAYAPVTSRIVHLLYSPDGKTLAVATEPRKRMLRCLTLVDLETGLARLSLKGVRRARCLAFSADSRLLLVLTDDKREGGLRLWDVATGRPGLLLAGPLERVLAAAFSPDGKTIATGRLDGSVQLIDPRTGNVRRNFRQHGTAVRAVAFSKDGLTVATGSADGIILLSNALTGAKYHTLVGPPSAVGTLAFSPDGALLASGHAKVARIWDVVTGREKAFVSGPKHFPQCLAFAPVGRTLAASGMDRAVRFWELHNANHGE
jgi:WD40 repeat protein